MLCILHVLIHYITQQQNDALCEQSLLCTENYQLHCFVADSKLQFNNNVKETHSHAQIILIAPLFYILTGFKSKPLFFSLPVVCLQTDDAMRDLQYVM